MPSLFYLRNKRECREGRDGKETPGMAVNKGVKSEWVVMISSWFRCVWSASKLWVWCTNESESWWRGQQVVTVGIHEKRQAVGEQIFKKAISEHEGCREEWAVRSVPYGGWCPKRGTPRWWPLEDSNKGSPDWFFTVNQDLLIFIVKWTRWHLGHKVYKNVS